MLGTTPAFQVDARGEFSRLDGPRGPGMPVFPIEVASERLAIRRGPFVFDRLPDATQWSGWRPGRLFPKLLS